MANTLASKENKIAKLAGIPLTQNVLFSSFLQIVELG